MLNSGEVQVWRVALDDLADAALPPCSPSETARAARFHSTELARRYLRSHGALRAILGRETSASLDFALTATGKPYLAGHPGFHFSLSRSHGMALVGVSIESAIGVDIERIRPLAEHMAIAEQFFPPSNFAALCDTPEPERELKFFRLWTRFEAKLKARGVGLYGAGAELRGEWTIEEIGAGEGYSAAVAVEAAGARVAVRDFTI